MSLEIQISSSLLLTSVNKRQTFFYKSSAFWNFFFPKSCLKVLGVAYTQVRLIHESLRYAIKFTFYIKLKFEYWNTLEIILRGLNGFLD